jgi:hypothetical protein
MPLNHRRALGCALSISSLVLSANAWAEGRETVGKAGVTSSRDRLLIGGGKCCFCSGCGLRKDAHW